jgi:hypothetical protein
MKAVKFEATIKKLQVRQAEEGGQATMTLTLSMAEANRKALAALCQDPEKAVGTLDQTATLPGGAKVEIPCGEEACSLAAQVESKVHECPAVHFTRISLDSRGGECQMRIGYEEAKTKDGGMFYLSNIGQSVRFQIAPQQATIDDEVDRKKAAQSAPVGAGRGRKGASAQDGPDSATGKETAKDEELAKALKAVSPVTLADARQHVTQKLDGKGIGATGLAQVLYGSKKEDRKVAAEAILLALVAEGLVIKTDAGKGEPVFYRAEK